eukprot:11328721-Alexandrium_andersonii.AAC.1
MNATAVPKGGPRSETPSSTNKQKSGALRVQGRATGGAPPLSGADSARTPNSRSPGLLLLPILGQGLFARWAIRDRSLILMGLGPPLS